MIVFPNCKINLGLYITGKRADGFHDLETIFYPIAVKDVIEVVQATSTTNQVQFTASGLPVAGNTTDNLCIKAYHLLKKDYPQLPAVNLHLHKVIPMGAGLGGGSADGAFTLQLLNKKFNLILPSEQLLSYALALGSDAPFFIINKPCYASGRGEQLTPIALDLSAYTFVLVNPGIHVPTGWAFSQITPGPPQYDLRTVIQQPVTTWQKELLNDFEKTVFEKHPAIQQVKETLYQQGALYAAMSGSGSTVFGLFEKNRVPSFNFHPLYVVIKV